MGYSDVKCSNFTIKCDSTHFPLTCNATQVKSVLLIKP